jgi:probable phosphoglycerate mutase
MEPISENKKTKIQKTIHLIRHGQTDFNLKNIIQGSGIDSDLNATGLDQAKRFYEHYKTYPYQHVYTSKLKRAQQSVMQFINDGIPHTALTELNEINWGIMEGAQSNPENAKLYHETVQKWSSGILDETVEGGETPEAMFERQSRGLEQLMSKTQEEKILICMHGRAIRSFLCLLTNTPLKEMEQWHHSNLCLYELQYNGECFDVVKANDISHFESDFS